MTPERWEAIDRVWQAVLARPVDERAAAVLELSKGDEALRSDVESLLAHLDRASAAGFGHQPLEVPAPPASFVGRQIGPYTILTVLGVGGMGEVYKAHDPALGREVALKILPGPWMSDPERRARFEREARLLASLNHPNIGAIYGVHESDQGVRALVLELVEGETVAERIARHAAPDRSPRGLPIDDVVAIARQLTDALEAAHERGIVHRDLKPANIKITPDGRVKVLDFGLARAMSGPESGPDVSSGTAAAATTTRVGVLLGTAAYMSPEQARGRAIDKRTDIWAFGCVVYEMLTGMRAFGGADIAETLANVIRGEPDWSALRADAPRALRTCLLRCLEKDPDRRIRDIADARLAMEGAFDAPVGGRDGRRERRSAHWLVAYGGWAVAALVALAAAATSVPLLRRAPTDVPEAGAQTVALPVVPDVVPSPTPVPATQGAENTAATETPGALTREAATPRVEFSPRAGGGGGSDLANTIQEAIDRVLPGGTIQVFPGTYREALRITKGLTIAGVAERTGAAVIAPPGTPESVIEIATTEPVTIRRLTVRVPPGANGIRGQGGVNLTVLRSTILAVDPKVGTSVSLVQVSNDARATGLRARAVVRNSVLDGTVASVPRLQARPEITAVSFQGDVDGVIHGNQILRAGVMCVNVRTRDDLGGETKVDIVENSIDECHPARRVGAILVGSPSVLELSPERPITATGVVNIIGNKIRNSSKDCLTAAITFDVFGGRIERNEIVDFVQTCARYTTRNDPAAIYIGLRGPGTPPVPPVAPTVRFNDIRGNVHAGLRIASNQTAAIDVSCNYWGSESGPSVTGPGDGDAILVAPGVPLPVFLPFARHPVAAVASPDCDGRDPNVPDHPPANPVP